MNKRIQIRGNKYKVYNSPRKDKNYMVKLKNGKKIHFGSPINRLASKNPRKKNSYCARSSGIKTKSAYSPNSLSRKMWGCK